MSFGIRNFIFFVRINIDCFGNGSFKKQQLRMSIALMVMMIQEIIFIFYVFRS